MNGWICGIACAATIVAMTPGAVAAEPPQAVSDLAGSTLSRWAADPEVVEAVREENRQNKTIDQVQILDEGWRMTDGTPDFMRGWIDSDLGHKLAELKSTQMYFTVLWVTDDIGANVAMTDKVPAYWHGEDPCFKTAYGNGAGEIYVGDVETDSLGRSVSTVCVPIVGHGLTIGVLHAGIDVSLIQ
jgi:hypothetical protein